MTYRFKLEHPESSSEWFEDVEAVTRDEAETLVWAKYADSPEVGLINIQRWEVPSNLRMAHLHAHTTFSFLDGYGTPAQLVERLKELGHEACAITDHGNILAHVPCGLAYKKAGIKPVFGCEFYICDNMTVKGKDMIAPSTGTVGLPHITILARTQEGYSNFLKLSRLSYEVGFYSKPRIDFEALIRHQEGLVVLSGCPTGYPTRLLQGRGYEYMAGLLANLKQRIEHYYVELVPQPGWETSHLATPALWQAACELGIPFVATADAHFPKPEHWRAQDALLAVGTKSTVDDPQRVLQLPQYQYYCSADELVERLRTVMPDAPHEHLLYAVENSARIADMCEVELQKAKTVSFPGIPPERTSAEVLWEWVCQGLTKRVHEGKLPVEQWEEYTQRAGREFTVLRDKGFCDYLLAVTDVILWMKAQGGLVVTRGSAGGCLLLWAMGASTTDPIKHGLSFERFYDSTRPDPPDVDIDFEQARREEAIEYIYEKYGRENCSQIAALSRLGPRGAVQDACAALGIHRREFAALSDAINDKDFDMDRQLNSITDARALKVLDDHPELRHLIPGMAGQYRHSSIHAAGVLVSASPLQDVIGVIVNDGKPIAAVDKEGAASLGFLKMDMLSVQALDVIGLAARSIKGTASWIEELTLDDPKVFETARAGTLAGVFQLDGAAANKALKEIGAHDFNDLVAASVLCRPGATDSTPIYRANKYDKATFQSYLAAMHPKVAPIVAETYGVLMYQEQVMKIAAEVAGLPEKEVHRLRKEVAKKLGLDKQLGDAWRAEWHELFVKGCMRHSGMPEEEAIAWWKLVEHHGGYSFNKSHGVTYGYMGYWMLWLKTYYPAHFYEAYLKLEDDDVVKKRLILEFVRSGGKVVLIDSKLSGESFTAAGAGTLVGGYSDLKFVGPAASGKIMQHAPFDSVESMLAALPKRTRELLQLSGCLDGQWNPKALIELAPWYPLPGVAEHDNQTRIAYGFSTPSHLPATSSDGNITVAGYVTWTKFDRDKIMFTIEDDKAVTFCRIAANKLKGVGEKFRQLKVGCYAGVQGWWTGDTLFANDYRIISG